VADLRDPVSRVAGNRLITTLFLCSIHSQQGYLVSHLPGNLKTFFMNYDKENEQEMPAAEKEKKEASIHVHDPFEKGNDKEITKEDLENVQKFKEASTERD